MVNNPNHSQLQNNSEIIYKNEQMLNKIKKIKIETHFIKNHLLFLVNKKNKKNFMLNNSKSTIIIINIFGKEKMKI